MRLLGMLALAAACSAKPAPAVAPAGSGSDTSAQQGSAEQGSAAAPVVVTDAASAEANAGKQVDVHGTARNAKLAAAIVASGLVVYCLGQDSWPPDLDRNAVVAHGKLEQTDEFASDGDSAGTSGAVWVLRDCRFETP